MITQISFQVSIEDNDSGTDTDTASSVGDTWYDYSDIIPGVSEDQKAEELFWAYQRFKGRYRRHMRKPVRRVRRFLKRRGKGKGKRPGYFLSTLSDPEVEQLFFAHGKGGKGKGNGKRSSGKGMNPRGADGQIMKCRKCGSIEHFQKDCPREGAPGGKGSGTPNPPNFYLAPPEPTNASPLYLLTQVAPQQVSATRIAEIIGDTEVLLTRSICMVTQETTPQQTPDTPMQDPLT